VPIYLEVSRLHRIVTIVARGKIAPDEMRSMAEQLAEAHARPFAKVVDVTAATSEIGPEQIARVAAFLRGDGSEKRGPVAFIVDAARGSFARTFAQQTVSEGPINVFSSLRPARAWLDPIQLAPADDAPQEATRDHSAWTDPHRRGVLLRGGRQRAVTRSLVHA
jgi:hypothetical protein